MIFPAVPRMFPVWLPGLLLLRAAQAAGRRRAGRGAGRRGAALAARTTSPRRWTWSCGRWPPGCAADAASAATLSGDTGGRAGPAVPAGHAAAHPAGRAGRLPGPPRAPGRGRDRPRPAPLVRRSDLRARGAGQLPAAGRPRAGPGRPVRPGRAGGRGDDRRVVADVRRRSAPRAALRGLDAAPGAPAGRDARDAQGLPRPDPGLRPPRAGRRRRRAGRARAAGRRRTTSTSSTCGRSGPDWAGAEPTCARWSSGDARTTGWSCAAGTCRGSCCPTAPSPRRWPQRTPARPPATLVGTPASAGTVDRAGPGDPRSGRRAPGAGRDPGRAVHRPRLDPAVPDRGRAGHGDGRPELARRRGGPGVRHPGGGRGGRRHVAARAPASWSPWTAPPAWCTPWPWRAEHDVLPEPGPASPHVRGVNGGRGADAA